MLPSLVRRIAVSTLIILTVAACAGVQQKPVVLEPGEKTLLIKVENFKFEPNDIKANRGDVLTVRLENAASAKHNLTIKSPQGATLVSVDIPAMGTISVKVTLAETGTYHFYCAKPFHSTMGMKGTIEVVAR
jgi:plastocyanin